MTHLPRANVTSPRDDVLPRYHGRHLRVCDGEDIDAKFPHLPRFIVRVSPDRSPLAISPQPPGVPYRTTFCKGVRLGKFGIPTERLSQRTTRWFVEIVQSGRRNTRVKPAPLTPGKVQGQADCFISYPLYSTMSKIIIFEWGSRSGDGSSSFLTNSSCLPASPALLRNRSVLLYGSPSKYICVTILSCRPLTWKWICAGLIRLGPAG